MIDYTFVIIATITSFIGYGFYHHYTVGLKYTIQEIDDVWVHYSVLADKASVSNDWDGFLVMLKQIHGDSLHDLFRTKILEYYRDVANNKVDLYTSLGAIEYATDEASTIKKLPN